MKIKHAYPVHLDPGNYYWENPHMNASTTGIWTLYQHTEQGRVPVAGATIAAPDDVDGDVLFDFMTDHDIIDDWGQYETDGDREAVAVMAKHDGLPDFVWEFQQ